MLQSLQTIQVDNDDDESNQFDFNSGNERHQNNAYIDSAPPFAALAPSNS